MYKYTPLTSKGTAAAAGQPGGSRQASKGKGRRANIQGKGRATRRPRQGQNGRRDVRRRDEVRRRHTHKGPELREAAGPPETERERSTKAHGLGGATLQTCGGEAPRHMGLEVQHRGRRPWSTAAKRAGGCNMARGEDQAGPGEAGAGAERAEEGDPYLGGARVRLGGAVSCHGVSVASNRPGALRGGGLPRAWARARRACRRPPTRGVCAGGRGPGGRTRADASGHHGRGAGVTAGRAG